MQKRPIEAIAEVMVNMTHHQRGAGCSTTPEILSVIQLKFRRFSTSGTRTSGRSVVADASPSIISGAVDALSMGWSWHARAAHESGAGIENVGWQPMPLFRRFESKRH